MFQSLIVLLYVLDNETNPVIKISCLVGLGIEIWKITKVTDVSFDFENKILGVLPRPKFEERVRKDGGMYVEGYDGSRRKGGLLIHSTTNKIHDCSKKKYETQNAEFRTRSNFYPSLRGFFLEITLIPWGQQIRKRFNTVRLKMSYDLYYREFTTSKRR